MQYEVHPTQGTRDIDPELNVFQHLAPLPGHIGSFKFQKDAFLNDPKCQKRGFPALGLID